MITPQTETSSLYQRGVAHAFLNEDAASTAAVQARIYRTFEQGKVLPEAQQHNVGAETNAPLPVVLRTDVGPIHAHKLAGEP